MHVVLLEPEIPPNTGSIARLCAATLTPLHLVEPLGFKIDDKHLKRAGLDYWEHVDLRLHKSWDNFLAKTKGHNLLYFSKRAERSYATARFQDDDYLVFGPETRDCRRSCWMPTGSAFTVFHDGAGVRSLNLSNAVSLFYTKVWTVEKV
jgi:tRNA (cytidine/uridine-2'-O-)-methyltransferase